MNKKYIYIKEASPFGSLENNQEKKDDLLASQNHPQPSSSVATLACTEGNSIEQEAIEFAEFVGSKKVFYCLHANGQRLWNSMVGGDRYTTEELYKKFYATKSKNAITNETKSHGK
jgi:hypothetical protein